MDFEHISIGFYKIKHKYSKSTELSKFIWELKERNIKFDIQWSIARRAQPYKPGAIFCNLCTSEAIAIAYPKENEILINSRDEIINHCRHRDKWKLENYN